MVRVQGLYLSFFPILLRGFSPVYASQGKAGQKGSSTPCAATQLSAEDEPTTRGGGGGGGLEQEMVFSAVFHIHGCFLETFSAAQKQVTKKKKWARG